MKRTVRMKVIEREPGILTIAECSALLLEAAPQIRAAMSIPLFCGIRDAELQRLDWRAVDMEGGSLVVGSSVSKFSQRRVIPIRENLRAWLKPLRKIGGPVLVGNREDRRLAEEARRAGFGNATEDEKRAGITLRPWPNNALRHSYASHRLAQWPDAAALALEMGNSPAVILRHYRQAVKPAAAEAFWQLTPRTAAKRNVVALAKPKSASAAKGNKTA